jgi:hypothetical protein
VAGWLGDPCVEGVGAAYEPALVDELPQAARLKAAIIRPVFIGSDRALNIRGTPLSWSGMSPVATPVGY